MRELYAAWARGDFSHTEIYDPDVVSYSYGIWPGGETETRGLEEVIAATSGWLEQWEHPFVIEAQQFIEESDRIAVVVRWKGRSKWGGAAIESENTHLWEFREGRATRFDVYSDRDQAMSALQEPGDGDH